MDEVKKVEKKAEVKIIKKVEKKAETFVMKVGHISWGRDGKNHFYADKKPLITEKVMGKYAEVLLEWLGNGWIEEGVY
ncbi:MAG: hypothetical protein QNK20_14435 [Aureibaculum sp.]|nr:hypothetical protein [Aureibaculum sp.]